MRVQLLHASRYRWIVVVAFLLTGFCQQLLAQSSSVSGVVKGEDGLPLPGVSVFEQYTQNGTATDIDGKYTLEAPSDGALVFSSIGYVQQIIEINGKNTIDVTMGEDREALGDAVVIGYGTRKKSHVTGAISQIEGKDVAAIQSNRVEEALAGKLAGVLIQNQDGEPGADPKIQVRAASSLSGDGGPLIVVDGYPISGSLATVNQNDIESIEVLKDAASAAIYGSRGANGVILVTTKSGGSTVSGKPTVSYNAYFSTSRKVVKDLPTLKTAGEWADELEAGIADGSYNVSQLDPAIVDYKINAYRNSPDVVGVEDWLFQNGNSMNHDVAFSGGNENVKYRASLGYLNTEGVAITQGFERYNARLNVDAKLTKKLSSGFTLNGFLGDRDLLGHDMRDLLRAYSIHPIYHTQASIEFVQQLNDQAIGLGLDPFDAGFRGGADAPWNSSITTLEPGMTAQDWHYGRSGNGIGGSGDAGPATKLDNTRRTQRTIFGNINTYLQYAINDNLSVKTVLGADLNDRRDFLWRGLEFDSRARTTQTALDQTDLKRSSVLSETTAMYNKVFKEKHDFAAVAGFEFQTIYFKGVSLQSGNVPFDQPLDFAFNNSTDVALSSRDDIINRRSIFGRVNYAYDNRYLASVSLRRDGDSRFGANNRFAVFPAVSVGWNVHNEEFWKSELLSDLRLRFSSGSLGTTGFLGPYQSLSLLQPQPTAFGLGFLIPSEVANPDLTWQTTRENNVGADLGFLANRIRVGVDYYTSTTEDMLINFNISEVYGTPSVPLNAGDVKSSGVELDFGATVISKNDLVWSVGGNFSTVDTEILDLDGLDELPRVQYGQSGRGPIFRNYVGGQIGEMWGIETTGEVETQYIADPIEYVGKQSGYSYAVDQQQPGEEGYGVIDRTRTKEEGGDLVKIGQNTPDFYWGFNTQLNYKKFDVSLQFQGAHGGEVYNIDPLYYGSQWGRALVDDFDILDLDGNLTPDEDMDGQPDGDGYADNNGQLFVRNRDQTDALIQDASYVALRNATIGYTLSPSWIKKGGFSSARIYIASTNLLYLMSNDYTSFNPEGVETTNSGYGGPTTYGVQVGASPLVRSFTAGFNVNF